LKRLRSGDIRQRNRRCRSEVFQRRPRFLRSSHRRPSGCQGKIVQTHLNNIRFNEYVYVHRARILVRNVYPRRAGPFRASVTRRNHMTIARVLFKYNNARVYHPDKPCARTHSVHGHCSAVAHVRRTLMPPSPVFIVRGGGDGPHWRRRRRSRPRTVASAWAYEPTGWARAGRNAGAAARESTRGRVRTVPHYVCHAHDRPERGGGVYVERARAARAVRSPRPRAYTRFTACRVFRARGWTNNRDKPVRRFIYSVTPPTGTMYPRKCVLFLGQATTVLSARNLFVGKRPFLSSGIGVRPSASKVVDH